MDKVDVIIIDDEKDSRELIRQYLKDQFPSVEIIAECYSVQSGIESLKQHSPDLLFLDIQLPDGTGFDILKQLNDDSFEIIFITAYEEYAINAIKHSALDYLLKPIDREEFNLAVEKSLKKKSSPLPLKDLINNLMNQMHNDQITIPTLNGFKVVNLTDLVRLESDGGYTSLYLKDGQVFLASKYLKEYEKILPEQKFCRIHHSHIINLAYLKEYIKGRGGQVVLQDGTTLGVSQNRKKDLLKYWE